MESLQELAARPASDPVGGTAHGKEVASWYGILAIVICMAVGGLALSIGASRQVGNWGVESDFFGMYVVQAQNILSGKPYTYQHYPPGYVYALAFLSLLTHDLFAAGKIISAVATALFGLVSYGLIAALSDRRRAFVTTLFVLFALLPHSFVAATDVLANLLLLLPLWILLRREAGVTVCLQAGLAAGLAYLVRYNAIFVIVGIPLVLILVNPNQHSRQQRIVKMSVFLCGALAVMSPWLLVNWHRNGSPFASDMYQQIAAHFYHPKGDAFGWTSRAMGKQFTSLWDVLLYDPLRLIRIFVKDILYSKPLALTSSVIGFPACVFIGAGVLLYLKHMTRRRTAFLLVCGLGYLLHGLAGFYVRFYFFLFPLLFLFVVVAVFHFDTMPSLFRGAHRAWNVGWLVMGILLAESVYTSYVGTSQFLHAEPKHLLGLAELLKTRASSNEVIMAIEPHIAYLTNLRGVDASVADTLEDYVAKAKEREVRYIVYSEHEEQYWSGLKALSDPGRMPKEFRLIYEHGPTKTLVYEIQRMSDSPH